MTATDYKKELDALGTVLKVVGALEPAGQTFVLRLAVERLGVSGVSIPSLGAGGATTSNASGAGENPRDAKSFLKEKKPLTDVQRIAVLAYYLTKHKDAPEFKTADLVSLNNDAGGVRITNPARAVDNATRSSRFLVGVKGKKRISAHGEDVVDALPDQAKVSEVIAAFGGGRGAGRKRGKKRR